MCVCVRVLKRNIDRIVRVGYLNTENEKEEYDVWEGVFECNNACCSSCAASKILKKDSEFEKSVCVRLCVCVCVRERELARGRERNRR
jgi:hypothetical protein